MTQSETQLMDNVICGPHCDSRILHAPQACDICDGFPFAQRLRDVWGINYTGESDPNKLPCPAEVARESHLLNAWAHNRARINPEVVGDVSGCAGKELQR